MAQYGVPICRLCKGEKIRRQTPQGYRYHCNCLEWKEQLRLLEVARMMERRRRR